MTFLDSLAQFSAGAGGEGPVVRGREATPDQQARYAANVAKRLGLAVVGGQGPWVTGQGVTPDQEARYAANVARRLAPPAVTGPGPDEVASVISAAQPEAVVTPSGFGPQLIARPPDPIDPAEHPAVKKRLAQLTDPDALAEVQRARNLLAGPSDGVALEPSPVAGPIEYRKLFPTDVSEPAARYAANVARRLGTQTAMERYGIPDITPPAVPQAGHGFLAHLKGAVEGLGAGLAMGHPLGGAIMGVAGGVNPQLGANAWYNGVTLPRWEQQTANNLDLAGKRVGLLDKIAAITGVDPITGEPTFAQQKEDAAETQHQMVLELRANTEMVKQAIAQGRLSVAQGNLALRQLTEAFLEKNKTLHTQIQQQNADTRAAGQRATEQYQQGRLQNAGQPRTSTTTKLWGTNPEHVDWEKTRDALLKQYPGADVKGLIASGLLGKEPRRRIQTGSTTTRGRGSATQGHSITRAQYDLQVRKHSADPSKTTEDGKAKVDAWMREKGYKLSDE